jgi:hypothetical protein
VRPTEAVHQLTAGGVRCKRAVPVEVDMSLGIRITQAGRAACLDDLISDGHSPELAERWCAAWEREAAIQRRQPSLDFWEAGRRWIDAQIGARRSPEAALARR